MLKTVSLSILSKIPPPPIPNDNFIESLPILTEDNSVPPTTDGGIQGNEEIQEMRNTSPPPATRTSTRIKKPTRVFLDSVAQRDIEFHDFHRDEYIPQTCAFNTNIASTPSYYEALHQDDIKLHDDISDSIDFLATTDDDTLHCGQAMKAEDKDKFKRAI